MPEVSRFFGIVIRMYFDEHDPPHFHAIFAGRELQVGIDPIALLEGKLPNRAESMVIEWAARHQLSLMRNWNRLRNSQPAERIEPLESDMLPRVNQVRHLGGYKLELTFTDGTKGELDFEQRVIGRGGVFAALEDPGFFSQVKVDREAG